MSDPIREIAQRVVDNYRWTTAGQVVIWLTTPEVVEIRQALKEEEEE